MSGAKDNLTRRYMILDIEQPCWDVQFYPYLVNRDDPPIFAVVSYYCVFIYMVDEGADDELKLLGWYNVNKAQKIIEYRTNSCIWCYIDENDPLLAISGESGQILVIKPLTGELITTLVAHGQGVINGLATHPKYPWIIASASLDTSIRIWDLRRINDPTLSTSVIILGHGIAHKQCLSAIHWHDSGRYIVSGGYDYRVVVWTIPDLHPDSDFWYSISKEGRQRSRDEVQVIHYPHFLSTAIHNDAVDAVMFVGDLVLSRAAKENKLVLWSMTGFHGSMEPPDQSTAVKSREYLETTNGFMQRSGLYRDDDFFGSDALKCKGPELYKRCLQFSNPVTDNAWLRFAIAKPSSLFPEVRLTITAGNYISNLHTWDLQSFIDGYDKYYKENASSKQQDTHRPKPSKAMSSKARGKAAELTSEQDGSSDDRTSTLQGIEGRQRDIKRFPLHNPDKLVPPTFIKTENLGRNKHLCTRAIAWSICGRWCVAVGEEPQKDGGLKGVILLYERKHAT